MIHAAGRRDRLPPDGQRPGAPLRRVRRVGRRLASPSTSRRRTTRPASAAAARALGLAVGVAFNPGTDAGPRRPPFAEAAGAEMILCMSIEPGYSGPAVHAGGLRPDRGARGARRHPDPGRRRRRRGEREGSPRRGRDACSSPGARSSPTRIPAAAYARIARRRGMSLDRALALADAAAGVGYPEPDRRRRRRRRRRRSSARASPRPTAAGTARSSRSPPRASAPAARRST